MCKLCGSAVVLVVCLAVADAFFLPIWYQKKAPSQTPAMANVGWNSVQPSAQQSYKAFTGYSTGHMDNAAAMSAPALSHMTPLQQVPMSSMQHYTYDPATIALSQYQQQMQMQPQFHNVQLVPCMCPITRDVIEQQVQSMSAQSSVPSQSSVNDKGSSGQSSTKT